MDIESINKQIQAENESYNRHLNRLQQEILNLKQSHQRTIENLKRQKEQAKSQNKQQNSNVQYESSENIFKSVNEELNKFI